MGRQAGKSELGEKCAARRHQTRRGSLVQAGSAQQQSEWVKWSGVRSGYQRQVELYRRLCCR